MHQSHFCISGRRVLVIMAIVLAFAFFKPLSPQAGFRVKSASAAPEALSGTKSICTSSGDYATLAAAISAIQTSGLEGPLVLELCPGYTSDGESYPLTFTAFTGSSAVNTVTIRPAADASGLSIAGDSTDSLITLNNATYVIFDGRPGGSGETQALTISNTNTGGTTVLFTNDASNNTLQYLIIQGVSTSVSGSNDTGVVSFYTSSITNGNDNNTIDHCDVRDGASLPSILIYSLGATGKENSGNTISNNHLYNYFNAANLSAGIYLGPNTTGWTITGNDFYQQSSHTPSAAIYAFGITISSGNGYTIADNIIGGSQPDGGGSPWTIDGSQDAKFLGISMGVGITNTNLVQGNTIANLSLSTTTGSGYSSGAMSSILISSGLVNVISNTIGSPTGTGSIQVTSSTSGAVSHGIKSVSDANVTITNNIIGSISVLNSDTSLGHSFYGILTANGYYTITDNLVGSLTTANSINAATSSTAAQIVYGIFSSNYTSNISDNTVANLNNAAAGASGDLLGIYTTYGVNIITGNLVHDLTSASTSTSTGLTGINQYSATSGEQVISQNEVYSLTNTAPSTTGNVYGMKVGDSTATASVSRVERNRVQGLSFSTSPTGSLVGIYTNGPGTYVNNLVSLGWDGSGAPLTGDYSMMGVYNAAGTVNIYFNTLLIGGGPAPVGSSLSYAFYGTQSDLKFENNLLINARNFSAASTTHSAACFGSTSNLTSDYNIFLASGVGVWQISTGSTAYTLNTWKQTQTTQDAHSISPASLEQVNLVNPSGGSGLDLHPQSPSLVEGAGVDIAAVTLDFDGQTRLDHTPVDIGAYAAVLTSIEVPAFSYTPLATTTSLDAPSLNNVTITASAGINTTSGLRPRLYYKRQIDANTFNDNISTTEGWKWVEAQGSGDSPFSFTLDYSLLYGSGIGYGGGKIQYFVTAQSLAATPVVGISSGLFPVQPNSVALASTAFPLVGQVESYRVFKQFTGVVTVCDSGCDYASLTLEDGLFQELTNGELIDDVSVEIRSDLTTETGAYFLQQQIYVGGPWSITFQPAGGAARLVQSSGSLFVLKGTDRVIIDGLNTSGNSLVLRSTGTSAATIGFSNDAITNTVRNCTIEGANTNSNSGVIIFGGSTSGPNGNDNNTISNNVIQDFSGDPIVPANLVYSSGTSSYLNSNNTIADNVLRNFGTGTTSYGIYIVNSVNENWAITGNTISNDATHTVTNLYGLRFGALGTNIIARNTIRDLNGYRTNYGIYLGDARDTTVSRNKIKLAMVGSTYAWYGIDFVGASGTAAAVTLVNNQVTINPTTSTSQALYCIYDASYAGNTLNAYHNTVYIGGTATGSATWAFVRKISKTDTVILKNNIFFNNRTGGSVAHYAAGNQSSASIITSDYNLFIGTGATTASFMDWGTATGGTPVDFAAWQSNTGGDSHSYAGTAAEILATDLFTDPANGDLSIKTGSGFAAPPLASNRGVAITGVTDDLDGDTRSATMPDLGAHEFSVDRTGLAGPDTLIGGWGYYDNLSIDSGAVTAGGNINVITPTVASGATLDMGSYTLTVSGSGNALSNSQDVTGDASYDFLGTTGVLINPGNSLPLGQTQVSIQYLPSTSTSCTTGGQTTVRRCYQINPFNSTGRDAIVRFYFDENSDLNGLTCANLKAFHYDGSGVWSLAGNSGGTVNCNGAGSYVDLIGVTTFSSFALADPASSPTAINLKDFRAIVPHFTFLRNLLAILALFSGF